MITCDGEVSLPEGDAARGVDDVVVSRGTRRYLPNVDKFVPGSQHGNFKMVICRQMMFWFPAAHAVTCPKLIKLYQDLKMLTLK